MQRNKLWARLIIPVAAAVLLAALPAVVTPQREPPTATISTQQAPPEIFLGRVLVNGMEVPSDTPVTAWAGGQEVGRALTREGSKFYLQVREGEGPVSFRIGDLAADQTTPRLVRGNLNRGFILTATGPDACFTLPPGVEAVGAGDPEEPGQPYHVVNGLATVKGQRPPETTPITAWSRTIRGKEFLVGFAETDAEGAFTLNLQTGGQINFRIGRLEVREAFGGWEEGGITRAFSLNAGAEGNEPCRSEITYPTELTELLGDRFVIAFTFDNATKQWLYFDPDPEEESTLEYFVSGRSYFIVVSETVGVTLNNTYRTLSCIDGLCLNLVSW